MKMLDAASNNVVLTITDIRFLYLAATRLFKTSRPRKLTGFHRFFFQRANCAKYWKENRLGVYARMTQYVASSLRFDCRLELLRALNDRLCIEFFQLGEKKVAAFDFAAVLEPD